MNRVCIEKSTNKLLEFQSGNAPLGTLKQNAIGAGYGEDDIEETYTNSSVETILANHETQVEKDFRAREALIDAEIKRFVREGAITRLTSQNKL